MRRAFVDRPVLSIFFGLSFFAGVWCTFPFVIALLLSPGLLGKTATQRFRVYSKDSDPRIQVA